jgi:hypothetical protein
VLGLGVAAACAHSVSGSLPGTGSSPDNGTAQGGASPGSAEPSQGTGDASLVIPGPIAPSDAGEGGPGDGSPALAANQGGTCVSGRSCDPMCDQLIENGAHEYIEQHPDDGSQIPAKAVTTLDPLFAVAPAATGGPCIIEPPDGSLFPNNWLRARIRFKPASAAQTIFQIRIHADRQMNDLVVYTESKTWEIPADIWQALGASTWGEDITVTVSAVAPAGGTPTSSSVKFQIAPAFANGTIVYWAAVGSNWQTPPPQSWLESFSVGDDNVATALTTAQSQWRQARTETGPLQMYGAAPGAPACIGCHVAVPDRASVTFIEGYPWDGVSAMVDPNDTGKLPPWLTPGGAEALSMPWLGMMAFSPHVWNDLNQHIMVAAFQDESTFNATAFDGGVAPAPIAPWGYQGSNEWDTSAKSQLGWIDLSTAVPQIAPADGGPISGDQLSLGMAANYGTSWGLIARTGDTSGVASPAWAHAGDTIVYASTKASMSGRLATGTADLWSVPYAGGAGGAAAAIAGASDPAYNEYYPAFSPDDRFIAFNRSPLADPMYYDPKAEVYVIPASGGTPTRLAANDPPVCMGVKSPGITNSWPKWSPEYPQCSGNTYYWIIFSSSREQIPFGPKAGGNLSGNEDTSQLYLTALVEDATGALTSTPGVFVWNQHTAATLTAFVGQPQSNHTPQWEPIALPPPPPPPTPPPPAIPPM